MNSTPELLEAFDIHPGDPFMGVAGDGFGQLPIHNRGRDRLIGPSRLTYHDRTSALWIDLSSTSIPITSMVR